ncbi:MAG: aminoglycoside phosphotransferase family protein [Clostridia bacterium]|nr:aminoglycoside phosphotransferase family protein [Clostridia bacterium]
MSITKNHQGDKTLRTLCASVFPAKAVRSITELTEGMFNAAYRIDFTDGSTSILKIAAASTDGLLSNEINLMQAEVAAMTLAHEHGIHGVARVQYADFTREHCSGPFFFMDVLPGRSLSSCGAELSVREQEHIMQQVGQLQRRLSEIHGDAFCLMGDTRRFRDLFSMLRYMFTNVMRDAERRSVNVVISADELFSQLSRDRHAFDEVKQPSFVHWDMWEGNIFVDRGELSGIIDWERAMWGDPYMDDRFRRHNRRAAFLEGFGQTVFTDAEMRRILWYDVFLYITMIVECTYRQYEGGEASWARLKQRLNASWTELKD